MATVQYFRDDIDCPYFNAIEPLQTRPRSSSAPPALLESGSFKRPVRKIFSMDDMSAYTHYTQVHNPYQQHSPSEVSPSEVSAYSQTQSMGYDSDECYSEEFSRQNSYPYMPYPQMNSQVCMNSYMMCNYGYPYQGYTGYECYPTEYISPETSCEASHSVDASYEEEAKNEPKGTLKCAGWVDPLLVPKSGNTSLTDLMSVIMRNGENGAQQKNSFKRRYNQPRGAGRNSRANRFK